MQTHTEPVLPVAEPAPTSMTVQCVILDGISWETYERLLAEHSESGGIHFTYDRGRLEIMVLSAAHEAIKHALEVLIEIFAEELNIDVRGFGSTTFRRADLDRGFEPEPVFIFNKSLVSEENARFALPLIHRPISLLRSTSLAPR